MKKTALLLFLLITTCMIYSQEAIPLYAGLIPNSKPVKDQELTEVQDAKRIIISNVTRPSLTAYLPSSEKANGTAVVICPGGGYSRLAAGHEGVQVAHAFNEMGVTAFVLKYRIPDDSSMVNKEIGPLQDAQRAIQMVRQGAKEWNLLPNRVGIMGFSAGGHLASTAGTHFDKPVVENKDNVNLRPDFMILIYPVISFSDSLAHIGSRNQLIGKAHSAEKRTLYSNELQITAHTPPTFLVHAGDDAGVKVQNSVQFYLALSEKKYPRKCISIQKAATASGWIIQQRLTNGWKDVRTGWR